VKIYFIFVFACMYVRLPLLIYAYMCVDARSIHTYYALFIQDSLFRSQLNIILKSSLLFDLFYFLTRALINKEKRFPGSFNLGPLFRV
jgi:hypothetical protein